MCVVVIAIVQYHQMQSEQVENHQTQLGQAVAIQSEQVEIHQTRLGQAVAIQQTQQSERGHNYLQTILFLIQPS